MWLWSRVAQQAGESDWRRVAEPIAKAPERKEVVYPFASSADLREQYRNPWDAVRVGRVLEDLDAALRRIRVLDGLVFAARGFVVVVAAVGLGVRVGRGRSARA